MSDAVNCPHSVVDVGAHVARIEEPDSDRAWYYQVAIEVRCRVCGAPFRFLGLPVGTSMDGATVTPDKTEAILTIMPVGE